MLRTLSVWHSPRGPTKDQGRVDLSLSNMTIQPNGPVTLVYSSMLETLNHSFEQHLPNAGGHDCRELEVN